jgi:hypothetical protein
MIRLSKNGPKRRRPLEPETILKQTNKAILALWKFAVIAGQQGWINPEQSPILSDHIFQIEKIFMLALPAASEPKSESKTCLETQRTCWPYGSGSSHFPLSPSR